jgi:hypothetical protein
MKRMTGFPLLRWKVAGIERLVVGSDPYSDSTIDR